MQCILHRMPPYMLILHALNTKRVALNLQGCLIVVPLMADPFAFPGSMPTFLQVSYLEVCWSGHPHLCQKFRLAIYINHPLTFIYIYITGDYIRTPCNYVVHYICNYVVHYIFNWQFHVKGLSKWGLNYIFHMKLFIAWNPNPKRPICLCSGNLCLCIEYKITLSNICN